MCYGAGGGGGGGEEMHLVAYSLLLLPFALMNNVLWTT